MATDSLTHNFVLDTPEAAESFANALELAEKQRPPERMPKNYESSDVDGVMRMVKKILNRVYDKNE